MMSRTYVGIDPAAESFTACLLHSPQHHRTAPAPFPNSEAGIAALLEWLRSEGAAPEQAHFCIENTGVYSELLCYQLHGHGLQVSLLDPRSVSKAFPDGQPKTDYLDAQKVAEYGYRYADKLRVWEPQADIVEQISVVLSTREQLVKQKTATQNSRSTLARKRVQTPAANRALEATLTNLGEQIEVLNKELRRLIRSHPTLSQGVALLMTAPGVGWFLAGHFVVLTRGFTQIPSYRSLAQFLGISPNEHSSGTSVRNKARCRRYGPAAIRKLLHLAARSIRTHEASFERYFLEKTAIGKPKMLVLNNIANKLLRQLCAMLKTQRPYIRTHRSVNPCLLTLA
jgi:transposase